MSVKNKRQIRRLAILCICMGCLTGCQKQQEEITEISILHGWGGPLHTHALMQSIYDDFSTEQIRLNSLPSADSSIAVEKANDMLAVDKMPDIISTNGLSYYVRNAIKMGKALNLMPYIKEDANLADSIHPSILEVWSDGDEIYTVPDALEVMGIWYNREYFRQAGVVDESGKACMPTTWDEFFEACKSIQRWSEEEKSSEVSVFAIGKRLIVENFFLARIAGQGEQGLEMASKLPKDFNQEPMRRAVEDAAKIYSYSKKVDGVENARQAFLMGESAIYFNGVWESEALSESSLDIGYANYPTDEGSSLSYVSPSSGYVLADNLDSRKNEAEIRFLKYMLSVPVQTKIALETGQAPSNPNVDMEQIEEEYPLLGNSLSKAYNAQIQIKTMPSVWNSRIVDILTERLVPAMRSQEGYETLISYLNEELK